MDSVLDVENKGEELQIIISLLRSQLIRMQL